MDPKKFSFVGPSCGHHASYSFFKAIKYQKNGKQKILSLGEFFFVKIWNDSDIVSIGELQLLWEDRNTNQVLSSLRLYFLPEYTPEGRLDSHGEDEVVAVSEKAVLRVNDLLDWIADPKEVTWDRGLRGICSEDCKAPEGAPVQYDVGLNSKFSPGHSEFLNDVRQEKIAIGDVPDIDDLGVNILSIPQYGRYRSILKRIAGREKEFMQNSLIAALGGFTVPTRRTFVLFCRDVFDYAELEEHPYLCNHLAPKLKGRPRKKKKIKRAGSPESESASSESSVSTSVSVSSKNSNLKNGVKKDLISILSQKNTKDELDFLQKLISFMDRRNTPIERPPMLGFKQIDLHLFFLKVEKLGGYEGCMNKKSWKAIYDELGGNPQNTSAATCTRRHYEKFLLPLEKHMRAKAKGGKKANQDSISSNDASDKESKSPIALQDMDKSSRTTSPEEKDKFKTEEEMEDIRNRSEEGEDLSMPNTSESEVKHPMMSSTPTLTSEVTNMKNHDGYPLMSASIQSLVDNKSKVDSDGKRLQIDDLIIIPNNLGGGMPEGGSALQNLAKIASRYQNTKEGNGNRVSEGDRSSPKRPRMDDPKSISATQAIPASKKTGSSLPSAASTGAANTPTSVAAAAAAANNFFSLLPPGLLPPWSGIQGLPGTPGTSSPKGASSPIPSGKVTPSSSATSGTSAVNALAAGFPTGFPFPDPSKLGPEGYHLLQLYERQLKATAAQQQTSLKATNSPASSKTNGKEPSNSQSNNSTGIAVGSSSKKETKERDRSKVCKPPPDNKRPPSLMQTPCAFMQTSTFYTNPLAEITRLKEAEKAKASSGRTMVSGPEDDVLDLSSGSSLPKRAKIESPFYGMKMEGTSPAPMGIAPTLDLSYKRENNVKPEMKASPFSAEALLSKPTNSKPLHPSASGSSGSSSHRPSSIPPHTDLVKIAPMSSLTAKNDGHSGSSSRASPFGGQHTLRASPASSLYSSSPVEKSPSARASPWHTPVSHSSPSGVPKDPKPAIPVSPVVRDEYKKADMGHLGLPPGLASLFPPSSLATSTPMSLALQTSIANSYSPHTSMAGSNPYLALLSQSHSTLGKSHSQSAASGAAAAAAAAVAGYPAHLMDPATSAYYAALYSQQMYGAGAGMPAGIPAGIPGYGLGGGGGGGLNAALRGMSQGGHGMPPTTHASGLDQLQASALQAMLARGSLGGTSSPASNPYASYASLLGLPGYGFPTSRKD
ncbi:AT-rich interactive domain-containing protein 5B-like [Tigriopus californicus]|uniref:AT-rich interactive domain-containing protein 5B-like n=1 Tax=Tigriopus californicus TaxID=6832 RepID=UPI0027D9E128|nr:AT-rich interactive domain-containing protein 5B-like [Tigriopus californicus]